MKNNNKILTLFILFLTLSITACSTTSQSSINEELESISNNNLDDETISDEIEDSLSSISTSNFENIEFESIDISNLKVEDVSSEIDTSLGIEISFNEGSISSSIQDDSISIDGTSLTINEGGVYELSGTLNSGSIIIDTEDEVQLILDGVSIYSTTSSAIIVLNADKLIITLAQGSQNYIYDSSSYVDPDVDESATPAAIYSSDDLYFNGEGSLLIESEEKTGIQSKDQVILESVTLSIDSAKDGIKGKDFVLIKSGDYTIVSQEDGITSTEDEEDKGYVIINGGTFDITSAKDGIHSENSIIINGGDININSQDDGLDADTSIEIYDGSIEIEESYEGIESLNIYILGGNIEITSQDDGINIATSDDSSTSTSFGGRGMGGETTIDGALYVYDGVIYINAQGDGLDSNGNIYMEGGYVIVNGPTTNGDGALDYNGEMLITGGTLIASGSSGMVQSTSTNSDQTSITIIFDSTISAGEIIVLKDSEGNDILAYESAKNYQAITISSELLIDGETYSIYSDASISSGDQTNGLYTNFISNEGSLYNSFTLGSQTTLGNSNSQMGMGNRGMGETRPSMR